MAQPDILEIPERFLAGMRQRMSLAEDKTSALWRAFRPRVGEIAARADVNLYSIQDYGGILDLSTFTPLTEFEKWAAVAVSPDSEIPDGMERGLIAAGKYAVFAYKGLPRDFAPMWNFIFREWLPASGFELDARSHFEVLGAGYDAFDPNSEEEIWVPVRTHA